MSSRSRSAFDGDCCGAEHRFLRIPLVTGLSFHLTSGMQLGLTTNPCVTCSVKSGGVTICGRCAPNGDDDRRDCNSVCCKNGKNCLCNNK